jgi:hypothetical protein
MRERIIKNINRIKNVSKFIEKEEVRAVARATARAAKEFAKALPEELAANRERKQ